MIVRGVHVDESRVSELHARMVASVCRVPRTAIDTLVVDFLAERYLDAKADVLTSGFLWEVIWQENIERRAITESTFLEECAWVILSAGMRDSVVRARFGDITSAFLCWRSADLIVANAHECRVRALRSFNHRGKIDAIVAAAAIVRESGIDALLEEVARSPEAALLRFPYIGPTTCRHLAKNLGADVAKPDRHVKRITMAVEYCCVDHMCADIAERVGERVAVVDVVLWRFATLHHDYVDHFKTPEEIGALRFGGARSEAASDLRNRSEVF